MLINDEEDGLQESMHRPPILGDQRSVLQSRATCCVACSCRTVLLGHMPDCVDADLLTDYGYSSIAAKINSHSTVICGVQAAVD